MLPLSLLKTAQSHPMLVELKNGETYNGHLVSCDSWMNINLRDVICTSKDGDRFWRMPECYIRGSTIKYLRIPDEVIDMVKEDAQAKSRNRTELNKNRVASSAQNQRAARSGSRNNFGNRSGQLSGGPGNNTQRVGVSGQGNRLLAQNNKNRK
ncbi:U6 snRNA-associated Sm-like protein LSm4 [Drosophila guanche]|uniref:U6 snRNA-associated Sm-like protein LSm4 n=1 Tax=Drosophila guanche TaxID=7266 RepID=UPI001470C5BE|nr:U6 snRNA-associated Sm-like protein LSm4 [Drosophila guanche]